MANESADAWLASRDAATGSNSSDEIAMAIYWTHFPPLLLSFTNCASRPVRRAMKVADDCGDRVLAAAFDVSGDFVARMTADSCYWFLAQVVGPGDEASTAVDIARLQRGAYGL